MVEEAPNKMSRSPKKSSKSTIRKVYHVTRETIDCYEDNKDTAVVGTFFSRKKANLAARTDLLNDWDMDFFESYEVEEEDGLVKVTAVCPEVRRGRSLFGRVGLTKRLMKNLMRSPMNIPTKVLMKDTD